MGFAQLFIRGSRTNIMDFSNPYDMDHNCFLTLKPEPLPQVCFYTHIFSNLTFPFQFIQIFALIKPFGIETWIAFLLSLLIILLMIFLHVTFYPNPEVEFRYTNTVIQWAPTSY